MRGHASIPYGASHRPEAAHGESDPGEPGEAMSGARRTVLAFCSLVVAVIFLWVPWTNDIGYAWLWTKPKQLHPYDLVAETRKRWAAGDQAMRDLETIKEGLRFPQDTPPKERNEVRQRTRGTIRLAEAQRNFAELEKHRWERMSDQEVLAWLEEEKNFDRIFPEKSNLDVPSRRKLFDEWQKTVPPAKEWNERVRYAKIDYLHIAMELAALAALCAAGFLLTPRKP